MNTLARIVLSLVIVATLFLVPPFLAWFVSNPIDVAYTFGGLVFGVSGLKGILNKATRVDRWSSAPTAVVLTAYLVTYWGIGTYWAILTGAWGVFNWWFLFFRRYVGMEA